MGCAISRHSQMLPLNCFAAGKALVVIFTMVSLCMFLPESVRNVYSRGCWPTLGSAAPFVYKQVRHKHAFTCARLNGIKQEEKHGVFWHTWQVLHKITTPRAQNMDTCAHRVLTKGLQLELCSSLPFLVFIYMSTRTQLSDTLHLSEENEEYFWTGVTAATQKVIDRIKLKVWFGKQSKVM